MKQNYLLCASEEGFHRVAYTEWGEPKPTSTAVICVHGLTRNSRDFDALAKYLSSHHHHVFCPDVVGRGESDWLKDPQHYNFQRYVTDMNILIARTNAIHIDWIGTSMGGLIGLMIAALPNSPIRRLILNDVSPQVPIQALWRLAKYAGKDPTFSTKEEAKAYFKVIYREFGNLTDDQWNDFTEHSITEHHPGLYMSKIDPGIHEFKIKWQTFRDVFSHPHKALEGLVFDIDLWSLWKQVKCPVLVIRGKHSDLLLPEHIKKMQRTHNQVDFFEVEDAGHAPALLEEEQHTKIACWLGQFEEELSP